jgi:hypothetical protein
MGHSRLPWNLIPSTEHAQLLWNRAEEIPVFSHLLALMTQNGVEILQNNVWPHAIEGL